MDYYDYQEAIFASNLTSNAKLTALIIASYYNWKENSMCWPSNKTLAKGTGLSISSIVRAKSELVSQGYLEVWRRIDNSNMYKPLMPENAPMISKETGSALLEKRVYAETPTNNEYNNEVNNEKNNEMNKKSSNEDLDISNINITKGDINISNDSDTPSLAKVRAMTAEEYWAVFESR
jgi:DNA-binding transcriptional MocR family regulator